MANHGYNLGLEIASLHDKHYSFSMAKCDARQDTIEALEKDLVAMQSLLTAIAAERQKDKKRVDLSDRPKLVDEAREVCPDLLPEAVYEWKTEDQINILVDGLNAFCTQITRKISPEMMYLTEELQRLPEIARIGSQTVDICRKENEHYVNNQTK
jgi:hypothetical protein